MPLCRVAVLAAALVASGAAPAGAAPRRVGFANLAPSHSGAAAAIDRARAQLPAHQLDGPSDPSLPHALAAPLDHGAADGQRAPLSLAHERLSAARSAYTSFHYPEALTQLAGVDRALLDLEPSPPVTEALVDRYLLTGVVQADSNHPGPARAAFRLVHHLDPNRTRLDPGEYRPQVVALYQAAVKPADRRAALRIAVRPAGAHIWLDGQPLGTSPQIRRALDSGDHWIVATAAGRAPRGRIITLPAGGTRTALLSLPPRPAAQRIAELRRAAAAATSTDDLRAAAAQLAGAAEVDLLVLVRTRAGAIEAASYDVATGVLSPWVGFPSPQLWAQLAPPETGAGAPRLVAGAPSGRGPAAGQVDRGGRARPSWYRTWWGKGLIIAGGVAVGGALIYAAARSGSGTHYTLGGWCFPGQGCP